MSNKDLIELAKKGANDAHLLLFDRIIKLEKELSNSIQEIKDKFDNAVKEIKDNVPDLDKVLESVRGEKGKDGEPGDKPIAGVDYPIPENGKDYVLTEEDKKDIAKKIEVPVVEKVIEKIETIKEQPIITNEIKEVAIAEKPEEIRNKLETLRGKERLDISAIDGLDEKIKAIPERPTTTIFGGRQLRFVKFSFSGNGSTTVFTLPHEPSGKGLAIWVYYNGQWLQPTTHYTLAGLTFTTTFTPESGTTIEGFLMV